MAKTAKAPRMTKLAAFVFAETAFHTGAGMEAAMNGRDYFLNPAARNHWLTVHAASIAIALKRSTANWEHDRTVVNPRARDLGKFAAQFALEDALPSGPVEVTDEHVKKASKKVSNDRRCRAASSRPGGGGYCEIQG